MPQLPAHLRHLDFRGASVAWIREAWNLLRTLPGGKRAYSQLLGRIIPYTGSIGAEFVTLEPGRATVRMRDRRALRNHLGSVHAIALCNLAELTGNAAIAASLPATARFIVKRIEMDYLKKARGTITASCECASSLGDARAEYAIQVELRDADAAIVAKAQMITLVGPLPTQAAS